MSADSAVVSICVVTHDSAAELPGFLEAVGRLSYRPLELVVIDCASQDDSLAIARRLADNSSVSTPTSASPAA